MFKLSVKPKLVRIAILLCFSLELKAGLKHLESLGLALAKKSVSKYYQFTKYLARFIS